MIINFAVPNTKEDIIEFMLLAASNIDVKKDSDDCLTKAWISKLNQVYQKAEILMNGQPEFLQIKAIYDQKTKEIKSSKQKSILIIIGCFVIYFILIGLITNPAVTIGITVFILVLVIISVVLLKKR